MDRFLIGLVAGLLGSGITYYFTSSSYVVIGVGVTVACLIWFGDDIGWF